MRINPIETHVFVSYSHKDNDLVTQILLVLRAIGDNVFHDNNSILYEKRWRPIIEESLDNAEVIIVFWCKHSKKSEEVQKEWSRAIEAGKDMVLILLDDTPLDPKLVDYQRLDLRSFVKFHSDEVHAIKSWIMRYSNSPDPLARYRASTLLEMLTSHKDRLQPDVVASAASKVLSFLQKKATAI